MNAELKELDVVALIEDLPAEELRRGQVGTIVHVHAPGVFMVEFIGLDGRTYAVADLRSEQLLQLHHTPARVA